MRISDWSSDVFSSDLAKPFAGERLVQFTQQLATLLGAGQPLDRALTILLELPEDEVARRTVTDIRDAVRGGASLSTALERQHGAFSRLYINMVRAGEAGGSLQETLQRLADYYAHSHPDRKSGVVGQRCEQRVALGCS